MKTPDSEKHLLYLAAAFLLLLAVIFFLPVIFQARVFYGFDMLYQYLPWSSYIREDFRSQNSLISDPVIFFYPIYHFYKSALANSEWPMWNALNFCGLPFIPFALYPLFFYTLFPLFTAHHLLLFLHLAGTGIFTYIYLREIGLDFLPSVIGAVSWMFNGYVMVWFEFEYTLIMAFTLPGILYFIERLLKKKAYFPFWVWFSCFRSLSVQDMPIS